MASSTAVGSARPFTSSGKKRLLIEGGVSSALGFTLMTNPVFDVLEAVLWGVDRVDAFDLVEFMTRDTMDYHVSKVLLESGRLLPSLEEQAANTRKATLMDESAAAVFEANVTPGDTAERLALLNTAEGARSRMMASMAVVQPSDFWVWQDRAECQGVPDAENVATQFYAPPSEGCNETYRRTFEEYYAENEPLFVANEVQRNQDMADTLFVNVRKNQNNRKQTYITVTWVFVVVFLVHMAALFAVIAIYRR